MSYAEFWPRYLRAHAKPATRWMHFCGSLLALACVAAGAITGGWWWFVAAPLAGYGFAWTSHYAIERNRPETFGHPVWSIVSDYRMLGLWLAGRLHEHIGDG